MKSLLNKALKNNKENNRRIIHYYLNIDFKIYF